MSAATIYSFPLAFNPQKALYAIQEQGLQVKVRPLNIFNGQSLRPEYMKINPNSTVPTLVTSGGDQPRATLTETIDILRWVDKQGSGPLGGADVDRQLVDELVNALHAWDGNLFFVSNLPPSDAGVFASLGAFRKEVAKAEMAKAEAAGDKVLVAAYKSKLEAMAKTNDADAVAANKRELEGLLDRAETLLADNKFVAGSAFSMADVLLATILFRLGTVKQTKLYLQSRPKLSAYYEAIKARPAYKKTFGPVSSAWGELSNILPSVIKAKFCLALHWFA